MDYTGDGGLGPPWHQSPAGEAQLAKNTCQGQKPEPLELVGLCGARVHVGTDASDNTQQEGRSQDNHGSGSVSVYSRQNHTAAGLRINIVRILSW